LGIRILQLSFVHSLRCFLYFWQVTTSSTIKVLILHPACVCCISVAKASQHLFFRCLVGRCVWAHGSPRCLI
jgi:hypothetical protein